MKSGLLAGALCLALAGGLAAQESGVIEGRVVNGTANGGSLIGLEVTLNHLGMEPMPPRTTITDAQGRFSFEGLPMGPRHGYIVSAEYAGVRYESEFWRALQGETQHSIQLLVYETTGSDEALHIPRFHHVVVPQADGLVVLELLVMDNRSDRSIVLQEGSITVPLPGGVVELQLDEENSALRAVLDKGALHLITPLPPGQSELIYNYRLPVTAGSLRWEQPIAYPIEFYDLLLPAGSATLSSPGLSYQGTRQIDEETYDYWSAEGLPEGEVLTIEFTGLPMAGSSAPGDSSTWDVQAVARWSGLALAALGIGLALFYPRYRQRSDSSVGPLRRDGR